MKEQVEIIDKVLSEMQQNIANESWHLLMWGWLVLISCTAHYALTSQGLFNWLPALWLTTMGSGILTEVLVSLRKNKKAYSITFADKVMISVWGAISLSNMLIAFIAPHFGVIPYTAVIPLIMLLIWVATLVTGITINYTPATALSFAWLLGALICANIKPENQILVMAGSTLLGFLAPSYALKLKCK